MKATPRWWAASAALLSACALTSKGEPLSPRYFTPALPESPSEATDAGPLDARAVREPAAGAGRASPRPGRGAAELRLGRVEPAASIDERIAHRVGDTELAYYEDRRWTEPPEAFVRRALERELFERRGYRRIISGAAPTLDVDVLGFEELRAPPRARLSLLVTLRDDTRVALERTLSVESPIQTGAGAEGGSAALARAMADAIARATAAVADQVGAELRQRPGSEPGP